MISIWQNKKLKKKTKQKEKLSFFAESSNSKEYISRKKVYRILKNLIYILKYNNTNRCKIRSSHVTLVTFRSLRSSYIPTKYKQNIKSEMENDHKKKENSTKS